ncbi:MAG TPA: alpha-glucan family phosphorylase [Gammaproteobacteria bacterium]
MKARGDGVTEFLRNRRVGYFSMEIALESAIPTYSGGLGVLAGDTLRSAADLEIPMVGVTLVSHAGYFRQGIDAAGRQVELPDPWEPAQKATPLPAKISVVVEGRDVWVGGWLYVLTGHSGGRQPVILLDTNLPENDVADRAITDVLYGGDQAYRLKQEIVLGIGGVRMLEALGFRIYAYHLNEGHSALLTLQLLQRHEYAPDDVRPGEPRYNLPAVRDLCHFTTHTPVEAGHDRFPYELVQRILGEPVDREMLRTLAGRDVLNTTQLALSLSEYVNGVAKRHAETSRRLFPGYSVSAITNGIHPFTWAHPEIATLYDRRVPGWCVEPELLMRANVVLPPEELWAAHMRAKRGLIERIRAATGVAFDPELPTIGYGRRMTQYKRPELLFADVAALRRIASKQPFQIVLAGKAHPRDEPGKRAIERLHGLMRELTPDIPIAFLPNYSMDVALAMVAGVDVWLNTPQPPLEASGTSGMKAALNGVPNLSVLDGWWLEGHIEGVTGWAIGDGGADSSGDAAALYAKLEQVVLPLYRDRAAWLAVMLGAISRNASLFHSHRMMRRYAAEAYLR